MLGLLGMTNNFSFDDRMPCGQFILSLLGGHVCGGQGEWVDRSTGNETNVIFYNYEDHKK